MIEACNLLHQLFNARPRLRVPFEPGQIPLNGIYILFEKGEFAHEGDRIVRVGTHTGSNQLPSRLKQHFITENKDRSIFRKNIGRCLLNKVNDGFLEQWEQDLTTSAAKSKYKAMIDAVKMQTVERQVSDYMQQNFSFLVFQVGEKQKRLEFESKIISTVSLCRECAPSDHWLGLFSPKEKVKASGLWLVNELYKTPFSVKEIEELKNYL